ncbi:hypothetical protein [Streptomyces sp. NPDC052179]|uniref:hypothetical protein n=1 Tax=Streptomyces sp. NPDC052179 TaxID=3155680 RepID=UPI00344066DC
MNQAAEDDTERARIHAELYAVPREAQPRRQAPQRGRATRADVEALMARLEAEDAALGTTR